MKKLLVFILCLPLLGCTGLNPATSAEQPIETNISPEPRKECDKTCTIYGDKELLRLATAYYTSAELNTDVDSKLNVCVMVKLLNDLSSIGKTSFRLCMDKLAESTLTGYNSSIQYLANKDDTNFFNVSLRCANAQFSKYQIKQIAYGYCID